MARLLGLLRWLFRPILVLFSPFRRLFRVFKKYPWTIAIVGLLAAAVIVWFAGPLVAIAGRTPLATELSRIITIAVIVALWALNRLRLHLAARRANDEVAEGITNEARAAADQISRESADEVETLKSRLEEALSVLKRAKLGGRQGRQYLYQLPWYILIGPPGSGKTTALINSGLSFPLADRFGNHAIRGVGGTRNCDWWFTDEAVLVDTAGRYTTQDSHQAVDSSAWQGFLDLLKKYRRRRPINGVLVTISLADLMQQSESERAAHASAIKQRIQELHERLGIRFPVYVLFTKCDLVSGFTEFFDDLGQQERAQVWGMTFPVEERDGPTNILQAFGDEFNLLEERLNDRLVERLQHERDPQRRALIFAFPQQIHSLKAVADQFLSDVFSPNRYDERALLRGVYLTSGTQEGTPIDRLVSGLASGFGLAGPAQPAALGSGRSYFITRLFRDLIFQETGLAGTNLRLERQRAWLQRGAYAATVTVALLAAAAWSGSYMQNQSFIENVSAHASVAQQRVDSIPTDHTAALAVLPALDAARDIPAGFGDRDAGTPLTMGLGLYQGDKLGSEAQATYRRLLTTAFLPRIILRLEEQLRRAGPNPDYLYEALKVYLMLDDPAHFDPDTVKAWLVLDWETDLPREVGTEERQRLARHLDALLEAWPSPLPMTLDTDLIRRTRLTLSRVPLAQRAYGRLKREPHDDEVRDFSVVEAAGRDAPVVFIRKSGLPLTSGVPGLYTYAGYHDVFLRKSPRFAETLAAESWILGEEIQNPRESDRLSGLNRQVRELYLKDYVKHWKDLLADIEVRPFAGLNQAVEILNILSGPASPLRSLLKAVEHETSLDKRPDVQVAETVEANDRVKAVKDKLARLIQVTPAASVTRPAAKLGNYVDEHFAELNDQLHGQGDAPAPIDHTLAMLNELYVYLSALASAADRGNAALDAARQQAGLSGDVVGRMKLAAKRQPPLLKNLLTELADSGSSLTSGGVKNHLNAKWSATVLPYCRRAIDNRYPLKRDSLQEVTLDDFGRVFGPGGLIDDFFRSYLEPFVDTAYTPWRWRSSDNMALKLSPEALMEFERAAVIKETFFRAGGQTPSVHFQLKPLTMDAAISQFLLDVDGQLVAYSHGPLRPASLKWPGPDGPQQVRVRLTPPAPTGRTGVSEDGTWAWFRLLDRSSVMPTAQPERFHVTFDVEGRSISYELRASSAFNPFRLAELQQFQCPARI